jgi:hypothetical protein
MLKLKNTQAWDDKKELQYDRRESDHSDSAERLRLHTYTYIIFYI